MGVASTLCFEAHTTYRCNLACKNCNRGGGLTRKVHTPDMTLDIWKMWLETIPYPLVVKRTLKIIFCGGEPTLTDVESFIKETLDWTPIAKFGIYSNEFSENTRQMLVHLGKAYGLRNTGAPKRDGKVPADGFLEGQFLSPKDLGVERKEPCWWARRCGISLDAKGMTVCPIGGAIDGILGLGLRTWKFEELTYDRLMKLCEHCGAFLIDPTKVGPECYTLWRGQKISKTWREALERLEGISSPPKQELENIK